ncbi:lasso peptide biosynthesis PqqD family chaperone [Metabacillus sp. GX 13764]|uniref:lasso peptide biosynthesis PqqD family chaperone n=1 Tax=Metabacillus kandeliae TaxID=2900151 RepID=UPI001E2B4C89|nr:lasso peptide biosynthesis PqqD family chaperone [Metabacillus kandeliae]
MIKESVIQADSQLTKVEGNIVSSMDGEMVMLSINSGKYYNFGEIGGEIWRLADEFPTVKEIIDELRNIYEVDEETCTAQVMEFLEHLNKEGLIEVN